MLRVSHLRKLVKPSAPCQGILVDLLGTEVGAPVSAGLPADILAGTVVATGAGYDFTNAVLRVTGVGGQCPNPSELTFSLTGTGPVPALGVYVITGDTYNNQLIGVLNNVVYAAFNYSRSVYPFPYWAIIDAPVYVPAGAPYELKCSIARTWVGVWLNGTRIARAKVTPGYLATSDPWYVMLGSYTNETYTGHVDSASLVTGSLPDIDVL